MFEEKLLDKQKLPSPNPYINLYMITYMSEDLKVKGYMAEPKKEGKYPGFLYLRGGIKNVGMVRVSRIIQFASEGFVVVAPFYRGNRGGEGREDFAGEDRYDAIHAYYLLQDHPKVKSESIHIFGFSRGGVMALITALAVPDASSVVTWGGVSSMFLTYEERIDLRKMMKRVIGSTPWKSPEKYQWRTPVDQLDSLKCPVLIIHGEKDKNVSVEHALLLKEELVKREKEVETWIFHEYDHYFPPKINRQIVKQLTKWMRKDDNPL